jgi:hypothetical protein
MHLLRAWGRELLGLFVGDGSHAMAIVAWIGLIAVLARALGSPAWLGPLLFLGLAVILIENVGRARPRATPAEGAQQSTRTEP